MRQHSSVKTVCAAALLVVASTIAAHGQYSLTVNRDRLVNAQNEPQNWLIMNGDYTSTRYSRLTQIDRDNVGDLRMVWALALGGMQDTGRNGPESELNPLVDNGFMYTSDGWGTVYKIDARNPNYGEFVWIADPGVDHEGNTSRSRGIALWEDRVLANLPDGRVISIDRDNGEILWDVEIAGTNEFGRRERFLTAPLVAEGKVLVHNGAGDGGTRGWVAALDVDTGQELWRWYVVPEPGQPGSETWTDDHNAWKTGRRRHLADRVLRPREEPLYRRHRQPLPRLRRRVPPRRQPLHEQRRRPRRRHPASSPGNFQYTPNDSWDYDEVGVHMLYDLEIDGRLRQVVSHYARNGFFYTLDRTDGSFIRGAQYVNDLNWTAGLDPVTGKPVEYDPNLDVQIYNPEARAMRSDRDEMKRACPTWHGGVAHQPMAYNPVKHIAYGVGTEGCFEQTGAAMAPPGPRGNIDPQRSERRQYDSDLYYGALTAFDAVDHEVLGKAVTEIEIRSGVTATAGGLVFTALQDGWIVAYNDETLEELWRFNVGTPLKGAPVTYAIGPTQYVRGCSRAAATCTR